MTPDSAAHAKCTSKNTNASKPKSLANAPGNHAYKPTEGATSDRTTKQYSTNAGNYRQMSTSKLPGNHGYPLTAGASSSGKKSQGQGTTATTAGSTGKDTPMSNPGNHAYPPTAGTGSAISQNTPPQTGVQCISCCHGRLNAQNFCTENRQTVCCCLFCMSVFLGEGTGGKISCELHNMNLQLLHHGSMHCAHEVLSDVA